MRWEVIPDFVTRLKPGHCINFVVVLDTTPDPINEVLISGVIAEIDFEHHEAVVQPLHAGTSRRVKFENLRKFGFSGGIVSGAIAGTLPTGAIMGMPGIPTPGWILAPQPDLNEIARAFLDVQPLEPRRPIIRDDYWYELLWDGIMGPFRWLRTFLSGEYH